MVHPAAKLFIILGLVFLVVGVLLTFSTAFPFLKLGRLPGDLWFRKGNVHFYFPMTTSILLSLLLSLILWLFSRR
jgi:hypothetical protein